MKHPQELHVVYIITKLELGGAQKVCLSLFNKLPKKNISTTLISGSEGPLVETLKDSTHTILLDEFKREVYFFGVWHEIKTFFKLVHILKTLQQKHQFIVVHTHSTKAGILGRFAAWYVGIRQRIHTVHGYAFHQHQSFFSWLIRYIPELMASLITTHFVCVSSHDVQTGIRLFPWFARKYSIIRAAVAEDTTYIPAHSTTPLPSTEFIFGTIACFKPQKNLLDLFQAFEEVYHQYPHARLEVLGDGELRPLLENWISDHNLQNVITLHGWQYNVKGYLKSWHVFTLSSLWEGLPCAIVEARLSKLPVICYNTGGIQDIIFEGKNGLLSPQKNWRHLAHNMMAMIEQPNLHKNLSSYLDDFHDFSEMYMVDKHRELYGSLR